MSRAAPREALLAAIPSLRAFAISLAMNRDHADDLVQDTLMSAWANLGRFEPGTNLNAWLFTSLRNRFYSTYRKRVREVQDTDGEQAARLSTPPEQHGSLDLEDMRRALGRLRVDQREALLLIGAEGMSYDEAAQVCGVAVGTIKSRVHRARVELGRLLSVDGADDLGPDHASIASERLTRGGIRWAGDGAAGPSRLLRPSVGAFNALFCTTALADVRGARLTRCCANGGSHAF